MTTTFRRNLNVSTLVLGGVLGSAVAVAQAPATATQAPTGAAVSAPLSADDSSTYATGKPLQGQSKEGFWGHLNPFARKKWVAREIDPLKDRTNELDQLGAKNANDIRGVDSRSTAGINKAMGAANAADSHAADAANLANAAQASANSVGSRTDALNGTVSALDQYQEVAATSVPFASGRTTLGPKGRADLDGLASKVAGEKGYVIEVQGYSRDGVSTSQAMADSVVRYLVSEHEVPLYRIYRTGLGRQTHKAAAGETAVINGVRVTLLHNSLATMSSVAPDAQTAPAAAGANGAGQINR